MLAAVLLLVTALAAGVGNAHFLLRLPPSLGYVLDDTDVPPCGGFDFDGPDVVGTNYSVRGYPFAATSTVSNVTYTVRVRLFREAPDVFHDILPPVYVNQYGTFCMRSVPVNRSWAGELAEYHVIANDPTLTTYQCSLVQFVDQEPFNATSRPECVNTTAVVGTLQPWGSPINTTPTPSAPVPTLSPTPSGTSTATRRIDSKPIFWLSLGTLVLITTLPFSA